MTTSAADSPSSSSGDINLRRLALLLILLVAVDLAVVSEKNNLWNALSLFSTSSDSFEDRISSTDDPQHQMSHRRSLQETDHREEQARNKQDFENLLKENLQLFHHLDEIEALGPSRFARPTEILYQQDRRQGITSNQYGPALQPVIGKHRHDQDVVMALAAEYKLRNYVVFVESLRETGFGGDIVLFVHESDLARADIEQYLSKTENLIVYAPPLTCFNSEGAETATVKGGIATCQCHGAYGRIEGDDITALPDPRAPRTAAIQRYELYWIAAVHYDPHQWIFLVDARDTFFQGNPFESVPRRAEGEAADTNSGLMYFYGENAQATRLGASKHNTEWLRAAYGPVVADLLKEKPIVCSGATLGEQVATEQYLSAMVAEWDDTHVVRMGADQGFHNYLYYSHKLKNAQAIDKIVVFDQGTGIVNNLGAMRTKPLEEWGNGKILKKDDSNKRHEKFSVHNWDGTLSPVVHQYDRHDVLANYFVKQVKGREYMSAWCQTIDKKLGTGGMSCVA